MKGVLRSAKNFTKGYSEIQVQVREATSNEIYGPTMTQLEEIARASYNPTQFSDIIYIIDKRLNDHGKNWRHVYKTLIVLEFCICCGADSMVAYAKERLHEIRTLKEFVSVDDHGLDNGACVREKCKDIVALLTDDNLLAEARRTKQPPLDRRPSSTGPIVIAPGEGTVQPSSAAISALESLNRNRPRASEDNDLNWANRSRPRTASQSQSLASRKSYDELQGVDEEVALKMALEESRAEFESLQISGQSKDKAYESLLQHASRSSSARSSSSNLTGGDKPHKNGKLTAGQLLDMDDESFADALESSWAGSRRTSGNLGTVLDDPFGLKTLNIPKSSPTVGTAPFGNSYPPSTILPGQNPFELGFADGIVQSGHISPTTRNPFDNIIIVEENGNNSSHTNFNHSLTEANGSQQDAAIHPIAIPGARYNDLTMGAKPVMPGNLAPQFGHKGQASNQNINDPPPAPGIDSRNEHSGTEHDPFADL